MSVSIEHPAWCEREQCKVAPGPGGAPLGAHRSKPVVVPAETADDVEIELSLWQIAGRSSFVALDWNRPHGVPVDGILFDLDAATLIWRVIRDLVRLAGPEAS